MGLYAKNLVSKGNSGTEQLAPRHRKVKKVELFLILRQILSLSACMLSPTQRKYG